MRISPIASAPTPTDATVTPIIWVFVKVLPGVGEGVEVDEVAGNG